MDILYEDRKQHNSHLKMNTLQLSLKFKKNQTFKNCLNTNSMGICQKLSYLRENEGTTQKNMSLRKGKVCIVMVKPLRCLGKSY